MTKSHRGFESSQAMKAKSMGIKRNSAQPVGPAQAAPMAPAPRPASKGVPSPLAMRPPTMPM